MKKTLFLTQGAIIAALYVVLTLISNALGLANYAVQLRFSEALTILPCFTPAAIPGLLVGCIISNLLTGCMPQDIIFGSLATLLGALGTYQFRSRKWLAPIPPILSNTLIIPLLLTYLYNFTGSLPYFILTVGLGEVLSCGVLGLLFCQLLQKYRRQLFPM